MSVPIYTHGGAGGWGGGWEETGNVKWKHVMSKNSTLWLWPGLVTRPSQFRVYYGIAPPWNLLVKWSFYCFFGFRWGKVTVSQEILQDLLPGPVTLVFERTDQLNPGLNPTTRLVGIRIPDHYFVQQLSLRCKEPLALTSANVSTVGQSSLKIEVSWLYGVDFEIFCNNSVLYLQKII